MTLIYILIYIYIYICIYIYILEYIIYIYYVVYRLPFKKHINPVLVVNMFAANMFVTPTRLGCTVSRGSWYKDIFVSIGLIDLTDSISYSLDSLDSFNCIGSLGSFDSTVSSAVQHPMSW